jgi:acyl-CoA synthetase (AMP-forming)/AMP-acid ligase II
MSQASAIRRSASLYRDNTAVWCDGREQNYRELFDRACRLANALRGLGAEPTDTVAVLSPNAFEIPEQAAGCALGNYPRATLYTYHSPAVNRYLLELVGARVLLVHSDHYDDIRPLLGDLPGLKAVVAFGPGEADGAIAYEELLAGASPADPDVPVDPDDPFMIRFSSGTTGRPKAIHHSVDRWQRLTDEWRWVTPMMSEESRYLTPISLAHLGVALLWDVFTVGGAIVPMPAFDGAEALDLIESRRITHMTAAPVMVRAMLDAAAERPRDVSSLQCLLYAGSPIARETMRRAIDVFGSTALHQLYAQSEALPATMLLPHQHVTAGSETQQRRLRSVGRPTPHTQVTIRAEDGAVLPPGAIGEVAVRSPFTMSGLWGDPQATAERHTADGSVLTRDMGYVDDDGFVYLVDRKDDMIVSGGYNIWPTEIEEALAGHPGVLEACVFGVPDERWGETPKAVVVRSPGSQVSADELITHTRTVLGGVKKITSVDFVDALPRTATGKVLRSTLKEPHWAGHDTRIAGT